MGISTHILDTAAGRPAAGVALVLLRLDGSVWHKAGQGVTDADGRCASLLGGAGLEATTYCIHFATGDYFHAHHVAALYPYIDIVFRVTDSGQHHHIPLLLSAHGYTTYRGS